jgi:hypothetical protein
MNLLDGFMNETQSINHLPAFLTVARSIARELAQRGHSTVTGPGGTPGRGVPRSAREGFVRY